VSVAQAAQGHLKTGRLHRFAPLMAYCVRRARAAIPIRKHQCVGRKPSPAQDEVLRSRIAVRCARDSVVMDDGGVTMRRLSAA
jgi:hypothetical protein